MLDFFAITVVNNLNQVTVIKIMIGANKVGCLSAH